MERKRLMKNDETYSEEACKLYDRCYKFFQEVLADYDDYYVRECTSVALDALDSAGVMWRVRRELSARADQ